MMHAAILILAAITMAACKSQERVIYNEAIHTDSLIRTVTDTVAVKVRVVDVPYALPSVRMEHTTPDTVSVLQDSLYRSVAVVSGGRLSHTLATLPHASISVPVQSIDTTKTRTEREHSSATSSRAVQPEGEDYRWMVYVLYGQALLSCVLFAVLIAAIIRDHNKRDK